MVKRRLDLVGLQVLGLFKENELTPIEGIQIVSDLFSTILTMMNPDAPLEEKKAMMEILFSNIRNDILSKGVYYRGHD